ncbi:methylated-DNA--[protein]-cysteine S-methyltransferase [Thorsellia anophelis]|uniref:Methylated-DNA--protein-cysteine methyltransferase n=1 Tax=Thorsellia anophelis DSM 18579 TaxID=1123402 RepID=A0A1I0EI30_9GAMM|nr:methylated-DNA--[protein]-cysteine S-methyltransferase [Thorsellia anophelis]SET44973.1 methylated-DNA-[protein]-cysteine S-methyltransferase [Thorsellia anophelis DSM 18579]
MTIINEKPIPYAEFVSSFESISYFNKQEMPDELLYGVYESPIGLITLGIYENALCYLSFAEICERTNLPLPAKKLENFYKKTAKLSDNHPIINQCKKELSEYFQYQRQEFTIPLALPGTFFQRQVWASLTHIPYGSTISYQMQAAWIHNEKGMRAVGTANGANPIALIIPCHRVIGKNGHLTGYAGGLHIKKALLDFENRIVFNL